MLRTAYLDHGSHDLPGFLVKPLSIPAGVQAPELCGQPVVFPQKECVHGGELGHLTGAGVALGKQVTVTPKTSIPERTCSNETPSPEMPPNQPTSPPIFHTMFR